jgi:radical SAM protein with 4Fe4S-binding SPASM domain
VVALLEEWLMDSFEPELEIEKAIAERDFDEKQQKVIDALRYRKPGQKLSNYILLETERARRQVYVTGYPYWLVVDPTNFCTLRCPFCPTGQGRNSRTRAMLSFDSFRRILDELGVYLIHLDLCNWGEPLLNRDIYKMIRYAKQFNIDTKVDSNLNHLDERGATEMILSGLDKIIVSIDGATPASYSKYRVGGDFYKVINNLELLIKKRKELNRVNPYISWQFLVFRHNEHEIKKVKALGRDLGVEHVGITKAFIGDRDWIPRNKRYSNYEVEGDFGNSDAPAESTSAYLRSNQGNLCDWPWQAMVINSNGSVSPCCSVEDEKDDFGNILQEPFRQIWNNERYRLARSYIRDGFFRADKTDNVCVGCNHLGLINFDIMSCHSLFT